MSMRLAESVGWRAHRWWTTTEPPPGQDNADRNQRAVQLRFVHMTDGGLRVAWLRKEHVRDPAIRHEVFVHRHF